MPRFAWTDHGTGAQFTRRSIGGRHDSGWGVLPSNYPHGPTQRLSTGAGMR